MLRGTHRPATEADRDKTQTRQPWEARITGTLDHARAGRVHAGTVAPTCAVRARVLGSDLVEWRCLDQSGDGYRDGADVVRVDRRTNTAATPSVAGGRLARTECAQETGRADRVRIVYSWVHADGSDAARIGGGEV